MVQQRTSFIDNAPHAMALLTASGTDITDANPPFCQLVGRTAGASAGPLHDVIAGTAGRRIAECVGDVGESHAQATCRVPAPDAHGREGGFWDVAVWNAGTDDGDGLVLEIRPAGDSGTDTELIRDVNRRLLEVALQEQELADRAEAASRAKTDFLAVVSHELRTPLTGIVGYTDVLLSPGLLGDLSDRQRSSLERLQQCSRHLWKLVDDLLEVASIEANTAAAAARERVDLRVLIQDAVQLLRPVAADKGLRLDVELPPDSLDAETDARKVTQILLNLLGNAVKFTDQGEVRLVACDDAGVCRVDVADTGIGIEPADMDRVFEPFVQAHDVTTRHHGGTGLGLAISRGLARTLGGDVTATSIPGSGSTFSLRLPRSPGGE
jgi:signal transduction histidine kinase